MLPESESMACQKYKDAASNSFLKYPLLAMEKFPTKTHACYCSFSSFPCSGSPWHTTDGLPLRTTDTNNPQHMVLVMAGFGLLHQHLRVGTPHPHPTNGTHVDATGNSALTLTSP